MQETNEQLASRAQGGDEAALLELWNQVKRLAWYFMPRWRAAAEAGGLTVEDLEQTAFLALLGAVRGYDPERGFMFSTFFTTALKREIYNASGIRTEKRSRDPLRYASSLDAPASPDAPEDSTLAELIPDPEAEANIDGAALRLEVASVLEGLPEAQRAAVVRRYWYGLPADAKTISDALRALRHPSRSRRLRETWRA